MVHRYLRDRVTLPGYLEALRALAPVCSFHRTDLGFLKPRPDWQDWPLGITVHDAYHAMYDTRVSTRRHDQTYSAFSTPPPHPPNHLIVRTNQARINQQHCTKFIPSKFTGTSMCAIKNSYGNLVFSLSLFKKTNYRGGVVGDSAHPVSGNVSAQS